MFFEKIRAQIQRALGQDAVIAPLICYAIPGRISTCECSTVRFIVSCSLSNKARKELLRLGFTHYGSLMGRELFKNSQFWDGSFWEIEVLLS